MTAEQAMERARKIRAVDFGRGQAKFDEVIARELLLAQAEAYEEAEGIALEEGLEDPQPGTSDEAYERAIADVARSLRERAAELRRAAEAIDHA